MRINFAGDYGLALEGAVFDPGTLMVTSLVASAIGGATTAAGTIAGGSYAKTAGDLQQQSAYSTAAQVDQNASQAIASGQRKMLDDQQRTKMAISTATARAGASGVAPDVGSPLENTGALEKRGSYQALMDMFNGESTATGLRNQADAIRYGGDVSEFEGESKRDSSYLSAAGTIAGTAGSMFSSYGKFNYPTTRGAGGVSL